MVEPLVRFAAKLDSSLLPRNSVGDRSAARPNCRSGRTVVSGRGSASVEKTAVFDELLEALMIKAVRIVAPACSHVITL